MESASYGIYALVVFVSEISPLRFLIRQQLVRNPSVNSSCAQPPSGYCRVFARPVSPAGGAFANFVLSGGRASANPVAWFPSFWHARDFLSEYSKLHRGFYWERKQIDSSVKDSKKLKGVVKACSWFYTCISSLLVKRELHSVKSGAIDLNQRFLVIENISVDLVWKTSFHIYRTIHNT